MPWGFAESPINQFRQSPVVQLKPWGRIEGHLLKEGKPLANELVQVQFTNDFSGRGFRFANGDFQASTDDWDVSDSSAFRLTISGWIGRIPPRVSIRAG